LNGKKGSVSFEPQHTFVRATEICDFALNFDFSAVALHFGVRKISANNEN